MATIQATTAEMQEKAGLLEEALQSLVNAR